MAVKQPVRVVLFLECEEPRVGGPPVRCLEARVLVVGLRQCFGLRQHCLQMGQFSLICAPPTTEGEVGWLLFVNVFEDEREDSFCVLSRGSSVLRSGGRST